MVCSLAVTNFIHAQYEFKLYFYFYWILILTVAITYLKIYKENKTNMVIGFYNFTFLIQFDLGLNYS